MDLFKIEEKVFRISDIQIYLMVSSLNALKTDNKEVYENFLDILNLISNIEYTDIRDRYLYVHHESKPSKFELTQTASYLKLPCPYIFENIVSIVTYYKYLNNTTEKFKYHCTKFGHISYLIISRLNHILKDFFEQVQLKKNNIRKFNQIQISRLNEIRLYKLLASLIPLKHKEINKYFKFVETISNICNINSSIIIEAFDLLSITDKSLKKEYVALAEYLGTAKLYISKNLISKGAYLKTYTNNYDNLKPRLPNMYRESVDKFIDTLDYYFSDFAQLLTGGDYE